MSNFYYKRSLSEEALTKLNKSRNIDINNADNTTTTANNTAIPTTAGNTSANTSSSPHTGNSPNDRTSESPKDQQQPLHTSPKMVNLRSSRIPHANTNK